MIRDSNLFGEEEICSVVVFDVNRLSVIRVGRIGRTRPQHWNSLQASVGVGVGRTRTQEQSAILRVGRTMNSRQAFATASKALRSLAPI